ncbi:unnamed protein product [Fusarium venenatum]|uniref:Uncharacterized protein n=1 Tax=Fusarium venenatum TaxID=56646 RepID=A0A2L2SWV9_9HYPO|nr:uncharacterized protein FVRRES_05515 [Fusarium venenatum]CEI61079.1 unnamed protein product [Fusarium venenatum]
MTTTNSVALTSIPQIHRNHGRAVVNDLVRYGRPAMPQKHHKTQSTLSGSQQQPNRIYPSSPKAIIKDLRHFLIFRDGLPAQETCLYHIWFSISEFKHLHSHTQLWLDDAMDDLRMQEAGIDLAGSDSEHFEDREHNHAATGPSNHYLTAETTIKPSYLPFTKRVHHSMSILPRDIEEYVKPRLLPLLKLVGPSWGGVLEGGVDDGGDPEGGYDGGYDGPRNRATQQGHATGAQLLPRFASLYRRDWNYSLITSKALHLIGTVMTQHLTTRSDAIQE